MQWAREVDGLKCCQSVRQTKQESFLFQLYLSVITGKGEEENTV